jgi:hypothetical protein
MTGVGQVRNYNGIKENLCGNIVFMLSILKQGIHRLLRVATGTGRRCKARSRGDHIARLPTFLIIGAAKGGTTSLYHYLNDHPAVYMSPVKEPHYFSYHGRVPKTPDTQEITRLLPPETRQLRTMADYSGLFEGANSEHVALGEASTGYLCGAGTPANVRSHLPETKLIALLRDPAERAWSEFMMMRRFGQEPEGNLLNIVRQRVDTRYLALGQYAEALDRWYAEFPREQVRVHLFEDFTNDTATVVIDVLQFIDVDASVPLDLSTHHNNRQGNEPQLDAETRAALIEHFRQDIQRLEEILDRDLGHWLV